jgi:hypothetical protein
MNFLTRLTGVLLVFVAGSAWTASAAPAQEAGVKYVSPAESVQKRHRAERDTIRPQTSR